MSIVKNRGLSPKEREVYFKAIIDRDGIIPKSERKTINPKFLAAFVEYISTHRKGMSKSNVDIIVNNLFKEFGESFIIRGRNISYMKRFLGVVRYCKVDNRLTSTDWAAAIRSSVSSVGYQRLNQWVKLATGAILSEQILDSQRISIYCTYDKLARELSDANQKEMFESYMESLMQSVETNCIEFNQDIKMRFISAVVYIYDSVKTFIPSIDRIDIMNLLERLIYANPIGTGCAPIISEFYNPFTFGEYIDIVLKYGLEPDYKVTVEYLNRCDSDTRMKELITFCQSNGNNLRFAETKEEITVCIKNLSRYKPITDYAVLKKAFPNGFIETTRDAFIRLGDIMTIPSDEVRAVFTEDEKIRILTERVDAKEQYLALFRKPNGMIYLSSAVKYLTGRHEIIPFMEAYVEYMETVTDYRENGASMDLYMASYIKKTVSMDVIIKECPKMLQYLDMTIAEFPTDYPTLWDWVPVAKYAPVINLTDGSLFQKISRINRYIPFNYHHIAFSSETFGIEEVIDDSSELCKLVESHPGYLFDVSDIKVKQILLEYLVEKLS